MRHLDFINKEFNENGKVPLVLLSGGLDSTYMVSRLSRIVSVDTMYVKSIQGDLKINGELHVRPKILEYFENKRIFPVKDFIITNEIQSGESLRLAQPIAWFYAAMYHYNPQRHSCVCIGYVVGDKVSQYLDKLNTAWDALSAVTKTECIPLFFPMRDLTKEEILQDIDPVLESLTLVCELPIIKEDNTIYQCGRCHPCTTSKMEKSRVRFFDSTKYPV